ncbi:MAG: 4Fe-4S binding protein [Actinobacteria bacterium]|nr:4Fe-4S binding protein [Actinomycetota bacterium]
MDKLELQLRAKAIELLEEGEVSIIIGWGPGWNSTKATPVFARDGETAEKLIFNPFCFNNLSVYLPRISEKTAIIAKPCDAGSIVALLAEGKISRDNLYIIGVACQGIVDPVKLEAAVGSIDDATAACLEGDNIVVEIDGEAKQVSFAEVALDRCMSCNQQNNVFSDVMVGEPVQPVVGEARSVVPEDAGAAWWRGFWSKEFDRCIRCYACREACPACYCRDNCAVQALRERWTGPRLDAQEALMFHAQRAMHVAGRCIECGACERACPVGIPLTLLHEQVGKAVKKLFNFNVGEKVDERPPLETFRKEELESGH